MSSQSGPQILFAVIGLALHLVMGFFVLFSQLLAPLWGAAILMAVWLAASVFAIRNWRRGPLVTLGVPIAMLLFWFVFLTFGDLVLGWTA